LPPIPQWDPDFGKYVTPEDKITAETAYIDFLTNPLQMAGCYVDTGGACSLEYSALEMFAEYSTLHTSADSLVLNSVAQLAGMDTVIQMQDARLKNQEASILKIQNKAVSAIVTLISFVIPLGRGSTGRIDAASLTEQLAMEQVMSDPLANALSIKSPMTDPRWLGSAGWEKWAANVNGVEIHFVYNPLTGEYDDFKFK
jgi:hypothetical protein